ncbi:MAG: hypothetical protein LBV00_02535 [Propionibacteriaceae bacterium]|jgi:hypothetical protein|nr:hypothetical protein [Propionibacteriaceae bacterium]
MDASGLIFAVLVVACLFYVVPRQLSWRIPTQQESESQTPLHLSMKPVHLGVPATAETAGEVTTDSITPPAVVSTILMRRAGRRAALRLARQAERRRRVVFLALLVIFLVTIPFAALGLGMRWWVPVVGFGVTVGWVVYSQIEARRTQRQLDALVADTELGDDEETVTVSLRPAEPEPVTEDSLAIVGPNGDLQMSLWEPITVVPATYISAPTAARTVRTIDLAKPATGGIPVTDDGVQEEPQSVAV